MRHVWTRRMSLIALVRFVDAYRVNSLASMCNMSAGWSDPAVLKKVPMEREEVMKRHCRTGQAAVTTSPQGTIGMI